MYPPFVSDLPKLLRGNVSSVSVVMMWGDLGGLGQVPQLPFLAQHRSPSSAGASCLPSTLTLMTITNPQSIAGQAVSPGVPILVGSHPSSLGGTLKEYVF